MLSLSCKKEGESIPDETSGADSIVAPPVPNSNRAKINFIWMATTDPFLQSMIGASLEIKKSNGISMFFAQDVRTATDVVFDWYPNLSCSVDTLYEFRLMDPGGNQVDMVTFNPAEAVDQDEFVITSLNCTYFLQLTWSVEH